jgi:hypothetical protein
MNSNADDLRKRMSQVRENIDEDVGGLVAGAKSLVDWRGFARRQPLVSLGIGFAAGYLLIPRRPKFAMDDPQALARALAENGIVLQARSSVPRRSKLPGVSGVLAAFAFRMIANRVRRRLTAALVDRLQRGVDGRDGPQRSAAASSPAARHGESTGNGRKS